ncbi:MAG: hypothetical protein KatS3mg051_0502 [Anaerolineae bacterium]|nr:MAG: hypothetical protein KatS3mg051_0502 [Anaerolineae bacterium]
MGGQRSSRSPRLRWRALARVTSWRGAIVGLLAQGLEPFDAALAGAYLHGLAGVLAAELWDTTASVTAGDVLELLPEAVALAERA